MPTNANTFNSRVTSEALEAKFRQVFPSQNGAELPQDLFASGVIQPVIDFSSVAEGSGLAPDLQTAWDFSTGNSQVTGAASPVTIISNTGFWKVDLNASALTGGAKRSFLDIYDGATSKPIWRFETLATTTYNDSEVITSDSFVVFLRSGDSLRGTTDLNMEIHVNYRQIADVYGNLKNPLGFTFQ